MTEPTHVDADLWELRGRISDAAQRVRTNPDPSDPEWSAALAELTDALAIAEQVDPVYRKAIAEVDAEDEYDEPACEGHNGEDDDLLRGVNIGDTTYCDGSCNPTR
jgi:hypothetical protein